MKPKQKHQQLETSIIIVPYNSRQPPLCMA